MQRFVILLATEELQHKDVYVSELRRLLKSMYNNTAQLTNLSTVLVRVLTEINVNCAWTRIIDDASVEAFINGMTFGSKIGASKFDESDCTLESVLHRLADSLPIAGAFTEIFWFRETLDVPAEGIGLYGALKRLHSWNNTSTTVVCLHRGHECLSFDGGLQTTHDRVPSLMFDQWIDSLGATLVYRSQLCKQPQVAAWHGSVVITGSQQVLSLSGFRMLCMDADGCYGYEVDEAGGEAAAKHDEVYLSPSLKFITECNVSEVPEFYLTNETYKLTVTSRCGSLAKSRGLLQRLVDYQNLCYVLRLEVGTSCKDVVDERIFSDPEKKKKKSWMELVKENIENAQDCPHSCELQGNLSPINYLVRAMPVSLFEGHGRQADCVTGGHQADCVTIAQRMRSPTELNGSIMDRLTLLVGTCSEENPRIQSLVRRLPRLNTQHLSQLQDEILQSQLVAIQSWARERQEKDSIPPVTELLEPILAARTACLKEFRSQKRGVRSPSDSAASRRWLHKPSAESLQCPESFPERRWLAARAVDDSNENAAADTLGKLSPPKKQKTMLLDAACLVKFFSVDGTPATECTSRLPVVRASKRLRRYDNDRRLATLPWPLCRTSQCHDVYYNTSRGNGRELEIRCTKLKSHMSNIETVSTCQQDDVHRSFLVVKKEHREPTTLNRSDERLRTERLDSDSVQTRCTRSMKLENVDYSRQVEMETSRHTVASTEQVKKESRSQRNRRKMEEVVHKTLESNGISSIDPLFTACFKRLNTITEAFVKDLPSSVGLRVEMFKIASSHVIQTIEFERSRCMYVKQK